MNNRLSPIALTDADNSDPRQAAGAGAAMPSAVVKSAAELIRG
jgi:hypothetical protein